MIGLVFVGLLAVAGFTVMAQRRLSGRVLPAMNVWAAPGTCSYSVRSAVAVRVWAAQPAGRSAPMTAMQRPPRPNSTSSAGW